MQNKILYDYFIDEDFLAISNKIKEMEKITAGEIRVSIKEERSFLDRSKDIRTLAEKEFYKLGMDKTRDKTGILLFLLLKQRQFYILADSGIIEKVSPNTWNEIRDDMQTLFKDGHYAKGITLGIEKVGAILGDFFPIKEDDTNELSNKVAF